MQPQDKHNHGVPLPTGSHCSNSEWAMREPLWPPANAPIIAAGSFARGKRVTASDSGPVIAVARQAPMAPPNRVLPTTPTRWAVSRFNVRGDAQRVQDGGINSAPMQRKKAPGWWMHRSDIGLKLVGICR